MKEEKRLKQEKKLLNKEKEHLGTKHNDQMKEIATFNGKDDQDDDEDADC